MAGSHCAAAACCVESRRLVGPDDASGRGGSGSRARRLDERAARGEAPARRGVFDDRLVIGAAGGARSLGAAHRPAEATRFTTNRLRRSSAHRDRGASIADHEGWPVAGTRRAGGWRGGARGRTRSTRSPVARRGRVLDTRGDAPSSRPRSSSWTAGVMRATLGRGERARAGRSRTGRPRARAARSRRPARLPDLQPLHVEQRAHRRIVVRHREQKLAELRDSGRAPSSTVMLQWSYGRRLARRRWTRRAAGCLAREREVIAVDATHAASTLPAMQRPHRVALAADVITVLAEQHVVHDLEPCLDAGLGQASSGISVACGESPRRRRSACPRRSATAALPASSRTTTTQVRSRSVSRIAIASRARPRVRAARSASIHASGEFHATSKSPRRCASTWRS